MYTALPGQAYESERDFDTHFNAISITTPEDFIFEYGDELVDIIVDNSTHKHVQSLGIQYPNSITSFIREGAVVEITDVSDAVYLGIVTDIEQSESYEGSMILGEDDEFTEVKLYYKYDKDNDERSFHPNRSQSDVEEIHTDLQIITNKKGGLTTFNEDIEIDIFSIVSDEFLARLLGCEEELVALKV